MPDKRFDWLCEHHKPARYVSHPFANEKFKMYYYINLHLIMIVYKMFLSLKTFCPPLLETLLQMFIFMYNLQQSTCILTGY